MKRRRYELSRLKAARLSKSLAKRGAAPERCVPAARDAAEQDDLGQVGGDVKIGVPGLSAFAGGNPFKMMALIAIALVLVARDGLRNSLDGFVVSAVHQFLFVLEFEEESRAVVIRGE